MDGKILLLVVGDDMQKGVKRAQKALSECVYLVELQQLRAVTWHASHGVRKKLETHKLSCRFTSLLSSSGQTCCWVQSGFV